MTNDISPQLGRPVRITSLSFASGKPLEDVCRLVDAEGARGVDLIALPETWPGPTPEPLDGLAITAMRSLAKMHRAYLVCPLYRWVEERRLNSAVLIDRAGEIAGIYDKVFPYWSEFDLQPPAEPGAAAPVFTTDFGRVGLAVCFDVNFPEVWQQLADGGAELVIWSSAYSAGISLQAHAINHHYYIVTSTLASDCLAYDITGELLHDAQGAGCNISRLTLDLDRSIYHQNFNAEPLTRLLAEHGDEVKVEKELKREEWFVLAARQPGVSARALARQCGLEELRDYLTRSRQEINLRRK